MTDDNNKKPAPKPAPKAPKPAPKKPADKKKTTWAEQPDSF